MKEPTQTCAADGFTEALQTAKYLEWRNRLGMEYDNGDEAETSKREALAEPGRWARVEAIHAILHPTLIAMLQPYGMRKRDWDDWNRVKIGLSELRVQTVVGRLNGVLQHECTVSHLVLRNVDRGACWCCTCLDHL